MPNEEIFLKELLESIKAWYIYLVSHWKIIILAGIIGATLGLVYSFNKKPVYTAALTFAIEGEKVTGGGVGSIASQLGFDLGSSGGGVFTEKNLPELFASRLMIEKTLLSPVIVSDGEKISLAEMYIRDRNWRKKWLNSPKLSHIKFLPSSNRKYFTRVHDSIFGVIYDELSKSGLSVSQKDIKISIFTIETSSLSELFSKNFTEILVKEILDFYSDTKRKKSQINMAILQRQTDSVRRELNRAITGVAVANDNTFNLNPALNVRKAPSDRRQVDLQTNTAILTELVKQTELAKITLRKEMPLIQIIDKPILPLKVEKFSVLKGIVFGSFLGALICTLIIIISKYLKEL